MQHRLTMWVLTERGLTCGRARTISTGVKLQLPLSRQIRNAARSTSSWIDIVQMIHLIIMCVNLIIRCGCGHFANENRLALVFATARRNFRGA